MKSIISNALNSIHEISSIFTIFKDTSDRIIQKDYNFFFFSTRIKQY